MKHQVACPNCSHLLWVPASKAGAQTNCPQCHHVFAIPPPPLGAPYADKALELVADSAMTVLASSHYAALAPHGIMPDAPHSVILKIFPQSSAEDAACEALTHVQPRLEEDLLLYPLWNHPQNPADHA